MTVLLMALSLVSLLPWATGVDNAWSEQIRDSVFALLCVTLVIASFRGWITWPPEKKRMQETIDMLVRAMEESNANTRRALPTTARLVEVVEQRVQDGPHARIEQEDLIAALRAVTSEAKKVVPDEQG